MQGEAARADVGAAVASRSLAKLTDVGAAVTADPQYRQVLCWRMMSSRIFMPGEHN